MRRFQINITAVAEVILRARRWGHRTNGRIPFVENFSRSVAVLPGSRLGRKRESQVGRVDNSIVSNEVNWYLKYRSDSLYLSNLTKVC